MPDPKKSISFLHARYADAKWGEIFVSFFLCLSFFLLYICSFRLSFFFCLSVCLSCTIFLSPSVSVTSFSNSISLFCQILRSVCLSYCSSLCLSCDFIVSIRLFSLMFVCRPSFFSFYCLSLFAISKLIKWNKKENGFSYWVHFSNWTSREKNIYCFIFNNLLHTN